MSTTQRVLPTTDRIYAAAAREIPLDAALQAVADLTGDTVSLLLPHNTAAEGSTLLAACGIDAARGDAYDRRRNTGNLLLARRLADLMDGRVVDADEPDALGRVHRDRLFPGVLRRAGLPLWRGHTHRELIKPSPAAASPER